MNNNQILQQNLKAIDKATADIKATINSIIDDLSFVETDVFTAGRTFATGAEALGEGIVTGYATIDGTPVNIFAQNKNVLGGSLGVAHAKKIVKAINKAIAGGTPLISIIDCSGARIGEGVAMLEAYAEVIAAAAKARQNVPHICIVKGSAVGMMASYVALADYVFMNANSVMSLASPMVLANKGKDYPKLNVILGVKAYADNSNISTFTYKDNKDLSTQLKDLLYYISDEIIDSGDDVNRETPSLDKSYSVKSCLTAICDNGKFLNLSSDFAKEINTVISKINGVSVGILATDSAINNGNITVNGIAKATDFVKHCDLNNIPLITLVDAKGFDSCIECEQAGLAAKLGKLMAAISEADNVRISVITGSAVGAVYSAFASKAIGYEYTLATTNAAITPVNAMTAVNVLYADEIAQAVDKDKAREELIESYTNLECNPFISAKDGFIDNIVEASTLRPYLASCIYMLLGL